MADSYEETKFSGWSLVGAAFIIVFAHMIIRGSFATLIQGMTAATGWSTGDVSLGTSLYMVFYGLFSFFIGNYITKLGSRLTFTIHGLIMAVGIFLTSFATQPWHYWITYGVIAGTGSAAFWSPVTSMVRQWFIDKLGLAMGLVTAASGLAFSLGPIISMNLIAGQSWQFMFRVFGIALAIFLVGGAQFTHMRPEEIGQKPLGFAEHQAKLAAQGGSGKPAAEMYIPFSWGIKSKYLWILAALWFFSNFAEFIVFSHAINYASGEVGFERLTATYCYCLTGITFIFTNIGSGYVVDKWSKTMGPLAARKRVLTIAYICCAIAAFWLNYGVRSLAAGGSAVWPLALYHLFFGFFYGAYIPNVAGTLGVVFGRKGMPPAWGFVSLIGMAVGGGGGPYIAGFLKDVTGSYFVPIWIATIFFLCAAFCAFNVSAPTKEEVWGDKDPE